MTALRLVGLLPVGEEVEGVFEIEIDPFSKVEMSWRLSRALSDTYVLTLTSRVGVRRHRSRSLRLDEAGVATWLLGYRSLGRSVLAAMAPYIPVMRVAPLESQPGC